MITQHNSLTLFAGTYNSAKSIEYLEVLGLEKNNLNPVDKNLREGRKRKKYYLCRHPWILITKKRGINSLKQHPHL